MKGSLSSSRFANLAAGGLAAGLLALPSAKAQGTLVTDESFKWGTTFNAVYGGNAFAVGDSASGTITFDPSTLTQANGGIYDATAAITYTTTSGGTTTTYKYSDLVIAFAPGGGLLTLEWNNLGNSINFVTSPSSYPQTPSGIQQELLLLASGNYDASQSSVGLGSLDGNTYGFGPVSSFGIATTGATAVPEPATWGLGLFAGGLLLAGEAKRRLSTNQQQSGLK